MSDALKDAMIASCSKDMSWKQNFGSKILEEEMQEWGKVHHYSSPSPAAPRVPAHSGGSGPATHNTSDPAKDHEMPESAPVCDPLAISEPLQAAQQPPAPHRQAMACVQSHVTQTAEAPSGVLTRSDNRNFKELEIQ
ncbi:hypothetical protein ACKKBG_A29240 [Auxenochlorella protothecoides x Auxenochlorella symbiontica]